MKVLVTGAGGMLGQDVVRTAHHVNHEVVALDRAALDIADVDAVNETLQDTRPAAVVNCAAWTDVDGAESDREGAFALNGEAAGTLAAAASAVGASIILPSTDYVFDGTKAGAYVESDPTAPQSVYGASKLAGEQATASANPRSWIVRTSWLFGSGGRNFVETMLGLAETESQVLVVRDQVGSPTFTGHLASGLVSLLDGEAYGIHHIAAAGECSWYDFATAIFREAGADCAVLSTTTEEFARPAPRPAYSVLRSERELAPVALPDWRAGLSAYLAERAAV